MMTISNRKILFLIGVISLFVLGAAIFHSSLNTSFFVQIIFDDAEEFARSGVITSSFMPVGYSGFLGSCMDIAGISGIPSCQALLYIGILFVGFWFLRVRGLNGLFLGLAIIVFAFYPTLVLNVWRVHDGNLSVILLLLFLASGVSFIRYKNIQSVIFLGIFAGLLFTVRQNTLPLLFLPFFIFGESIYSMAKERKLFFSYIRKVLLFSLVAILSMIFVNIATKGKPVFFGGQGPYNFFAGANEYTAEYLVKDYSAENSLQGALEARGFSSVSTFEERLKFSPSTYTKLAVEYIRDNPLQHVKLTALKVYTFFRPGYHVPSDFSWFSVDGITRVVKILLAVPFFVWLFLVYVTRKRFFDKEYLFVFFVILLYMIPFFVANSDPRYRFPLDIVFILDSFCRARDYWITRTEP